MSVHTVINLSQEHFLNNKRFYMTGKAGSSKHVRIRIDTIAGHWEKEFPISAKIKDILYAAIRYFELTRSGHYALKLKRKSETVLIPARSLNRYKIKDGDVLVLEVMGIY